MDGFGQIGKRLKLTKDRAEFSLKREVPPQRSRERIRDLMDSDNPVRAVINTPTTAKQVLVDFNFGRKLPSLECCGDCLCGITESYTSDSLIGNNLYVTTPYVPGSVVLYINGTKANSGTDFIESDPVNRQLTVLVPATTFVVSYVYTVGNCTESICIDERFECLDFGFMTGLTTVFSDRFDRSENTGPSGGCGYYFNTITLAETFPTISTGVASFATNTAAWLGGVDRAVGKSVEVLAAVNLDNLSINSSLTFNLRGIVNLGSQDLVAATFTFTKLSSTTLRIRIGAGGAALEFVDNPFGVIDTDTFDLVGGTNETTITIEGGRYWLRFAQIPGQWAAKAWPQFGTEPAAQVSYQLSDTYLTDPADTNEVDRVLVQHTITNLTINGSGFEAIMVGAGLDTGDWGLVASTQGVQGYYCAEIPDGLVRFGYNCGVNGSSTTTVGTVSDPSTSWTYSYPHFAGSDGGLGRIIDYTQNIMAISTGTTTYGHPRAIRIRGQIVGSVWDNPIFVELKSYPSGPLTMGGINGIQGGTTLATYLVPKDGTPLDVDVFVTIPPNEQYVRIGVHAPNLASLASQQPFFSGPPTFPNNAGSSINFYHLRAEAVQSVDCTTGPFCDDCTTRRCAELTENFDADTVTRAFGTTSFTRVPTDGIPYFTSKGTNSQAVYSGGVQTVSFQGSSGKTFNTEYASPLDCSYPDYSPNWEAYFELRLGSPTGVELGTISFGSFDIDVDSSGTFFPASFGISPSYTSTNLTLGSWYSIRNRQEDGSVYLKIWLAGTPEPTSWNYTGTVVSAPSVYTIGSFSSGGSSPTFTTELRAISIKGV